MNGSGEKFEKTVSKKYFKQLTVSLSVTVRFTRTVIVDFHCQWKSSSDWSPVDSDRRSPELQSLAMDSYYAHTATGIMQHSSKRPVPQANSSAIKAIKPRTTRLPATATGPAVLETPSAT